MSAESARSPSGAEERWGISHDELSQRQRMHVDAAADAERVCEECGRRVTMTETKGEVGHSRGRKADRCSQYEGPL